VPSRRPSCTTVRCQGIGGPAQRRGPYKLKTTEVSPSGMAGAETGRYKGLLSASSICKARAATWSTVMSFMQRW